MSDAGKCETLVDAAGIGREELDEQALDDQVLDGQALDDQVLDEQALDDQVLDGQALDEVGRVACVLEREGRFGLTRGFIQHGDVSVYRHVISVARASVAVARALERLGVRMDRSSLVRGALLHDYFLYDWHDPDPSHRLHGFTHPSAALACAEQDFDLTARERNIISRHMFPLVPLPPTCREAWVVCMADKYCALCETVASRLPVRRVKTGEVR